MKRQTKQKKTKKQKHTHKKHTTLSEQYQIPIKVVKRGKTDTP